MKPDWVFRFSRWHVLLVVAGALSWFALLAGIAAMCGRVR